MNNEAMVIAPFHRTYEKLDQVSSDRL